LFIGGRNPKMLVAMDADTGKVIGQGFPIGDRVDANIFDSETGMIAAATREGTIHIFHEDSPDKISVVETIKSEFGAKTMALDPNLYARAWLCIGRSQWGSGTRLGRRLVSRAHQRWLLFLPSAASTEWKHVLKRVYGFPQ